MPHIKVSLFLFLTVVTVMGQPVPPPATQAEVAAGVNRFKYVTPFTLASSGGIGGSNVSYVSVSTNVFTNGMNLTNAVKAAAARATFLNPVTVEIGAGTYGIIENTVPSVMLQSNVRIYWHPGAKWWCGDNSAPAHMFEADGTAVTNCGVYGYGQFYMTNDGASMLVMINNGTVGEVDFECESVYAGGGNAANFSNTAASNVVRIAVKKELYAGYDVWYGGGTKAKLYFKANRIVSGGDLVETTTGFDTLGDCKVDVDWAQLGTNQSTLMQLGKNVDIRVGTLWNSHGKHIHNVGTGYAYVRDSTIVTTNNATRSVVARDLAGLVDAHTGIWFKNCVFDFPAPLDPVVVTNLAGFNLRLENCSFINLSALGTNWARPEALLFPNMVEILGNFYTSPPRLAHTNVAILGGRSATPLALSQTAVASAGVTATNLQVFHTAPHQLTNTASGFKVTASGTTLTGGTNRWQLIWGSETIADSGTITNNGTGGWQIEATVRNNGNANFKSQNVNYRFLTTGIGLPYRETNNAFLTFQTNGISTALRLVTTSQTHGSVTNHNWLVEYLAPQ